MKQHARVAGRMPFSPPDRPEDRSARHGAKEAGATVSWLIGASVHVFNDRFDFQGTQTGEKGPKHAQTIS